MDVLGNPHRVMVSACCPDPVTAVTHPSVCLRALLMAVGSRGDEMNAFVVHDPVRSPVHGIGSSCRICTPVRAQQFIRLRISTTDIVLIQNYTELFELTRSQCGSHILDAKAIKKEKWRGVRCVVCVGGGGGGCWAIATTFI